MDNTRVTKLARQVTGAVNLHHKTAEGHSAFPDGLYIYISQYFSSEIDSNKHHHSIKQLLIYKLYSCDVTSIKEKKKTYFLGSTEQLITV